MKQGWKYKPFGEVFPIKMGKTPPRGDKSCWDTKKESENKWVSISDISQNEGKVIFDTKEYITDAATEKIFRVKANSLLMSFKLTIGKMAFAGTDLYTNEAIIAIPENKEYNLKFLYFYLSSYNWSSLTDGNEKIKGKTLNKESIGRIKLPIIPLSDQQRIVSYLDAEFAKIEALKANAEKQLQAAKDLFQAALKELLTPKEGWKEGSVGDFLNFKRGYDLTHAQMRGGDIPVAGSNGIIGYHNIATNISPCITVGRSGSVGKLNIYDKCWAHNTTLYVEDFKGNYPYFLVYLIQSLGIASYGGGSAVPTLNRNNIHPIKTAVPNITEQQRIADRLDALSANLKALQTNYTETITLCNDLKQALLKKVFG